MAHIVIRAPRRPVFMLGSLLVLLIGLEVGQRALDALKAARRDAPDVYSLYFVTASGLPLTDRRGSIALVLDPHLVYRMRPDQRLEGVTINAQGFRGATVAREKPAGTVRVIALGGSVAFGQGASRDEAVWTAHLARVLAAQLPGRTVEVMNAATQGYDSMQERLLLETELLDLRPDLVLVLDGWNDMNASTGVDASKPLVMGTFYEVDRVLTQSKQWAQNVLRLSAVHRAIERGLDRAARSRALEAGERWRVHPDAVGRYRRNLDAMCRLARSVDAPLVIVAQPELFARAEPVPTAEVEVRTKVDEGGYAAHVRANYPLFRDQARAAAEAGGARFVDGTTIFDGRPDAVFVDQVHVNDRGNELIAESLAPAVMAALGSR